MKRTNKSRNPDVILTSDWHLREDIPACRKDGIEFEYNQWRKMDQIVALQEKYNCPVVHAGDLFHHWKPSPYLIAGAIFNMPKKFFMVYGQHDLPQHNLELAVKCGVQPLIQAGVVTILEKGSWGQDIGTFGGDFRRLIGVWHKFVWDGENIPWPNCEEMTAREVLKKNPNYDLIVTGDHHKPFTQEYEGRLLVNPGCLMRQTADYANHRPRVYLYYADDNTVQPYYLNIQNGVVSREHIEKKEERDKRIEAFISRLSDEWELSLSFEENLSRFLISNRVRSDVRKLIYKAIDQ